MSKKSNQSYRVALFIIFALAVIPLTVSADVYIYPPAIITTPGTYVLQGGVTNYAGPTPVIQIVSNDVVLDGNGITLDGVDAPGSIGIAVAPGVQRVHIKDVTVRDFDIGIQYLTVRRGLIEHVTAFSNRVGISVRFSRDIIIRNSTTNSNTNYGILSGSNNRNIIENNIANSNGNRGIFSFNALREQIIHNSARYNSIYGIYYRGRGGFIDENTVTDNGWFGIYAIYSRATSISNNTVRDNTQGPPGISGIYVFSSPPTLGNPNGLIIDNNTVNRNFDGITLTAGSHDNTVTNNTVTDNQLNGIVLRNPFTRFNLVNNNTVRNNVNFGIVLEGAPSNIISNNSIIDNREGIVLQPFGGGNSNNNRVLNNSVFQPLPAPAGSGDTGIRLQGINSASRITGNRVDANTVQNYKHGIYLRFAQVNTILDNTIIGNTLEGMWLSDSTLNNIYNNCFNNSVNVAFDPLTILQNNWNTVITPGPNIVGGKYLGGNYWAKPDGTGHSQVTPPNDDEFSNAALSIAAGNTDNFPLWNPIHASFTTSPSPPNGNVPFKVQFNDTSAGYPTCWKWEFGDGETSDIQNPNHTYTVDGTYDVNLTVSRCDVIGCAASSTYSRVVHVGPQADFTATPLVGPAPLTVAFTDLSTISGTTYTWQYRLNGTTTWKPLTLSSPGMLYKFETPGLYDIKLTITGTTGTHSKEKYKFIDVRVPFGPVAHFTASPPFGDAPLYVQFIDNSTGSITKWEWDFNNDGTIDSTQTNPSHTYPTAGYHTVKLTVRNANCTNTNTMTIRVDTPKPIPDFIATPRSGYYPLKVYFYDTSTGLTPNTQYRWDFGDGSPQSTLRNPEHTYTSEGNWDVHLWVTNPGPPGFVETDDLLKPDYIIVSKDPIPVATILTASEGDMPFTVYFTATSSYSPVTWLWNFGDGASANEQNPSHTFKEPGVYTVTLRVFDVQGRGTQDTKYVTVRPVADFTANPPSGNAPLTVQFTDTSLGNPTVFEWDFRDGSTSTLKNPSHTFINWSTYYVRHRVKANGVWSTWKERPVAIGSTPGINANRTTGYIPLTVSFTGISGGYPVDWLWEFGDTLYQRGSDHATHTYEDTGIYTVKLTAYYNDRDPVNTTKVIKVYPKANFTATPMQGNAPLTVQLTDTSLGTIANYWWYSWDIDELSSTDKNTSFTYTISGGRYISHQVKTPEGLIDSIYYYISIYPTADFTWYPSQGEEPLTVQFVDTSLGGGYSAFWDFGDGTNTTWRLGSDTVGRSAPVHVYQELGTYDVSLTLMGYDDLPNTTTKRVNLRERPPVADFTGTPRAGSAPLTVDFTDLSSGTTPITYYWEFGDGATSTLKNPSHKYTANGDYNVRLTVTNAGGSDPELKTAYIRVSNVPLPVAEFTASPRDGLEDLSVQFKDTSINSPTSWLWDFGDGATSNLQSPIHVYTIPGRYNVILTVSNAQGQNVIIKSNHIYVRNTPPVAAFTATPLSGDAPLSVKFTDQSTGLAITSWKWDFGDGGTSTTQSPVYVYNNAGTFAVNLTVANDGGADSEVKSAYITVNPAPPSNLIQLYPGWNFVSVPQRLASGHNTAIQVFGGVNLGGRAILLWDANSGYWKQVIAGDIVKPLDGYWIYSVTRIDVPLTFDTSTPPSPTPKQLYTGYNAIGYTGTTSMSAHNFLTISGGLNGNWDILYGYHNGAIPDTPIIRDSNDGMPMYPTKGYWIKMNSNDTLTVVV